MVLVKLTSSTVPNNIYLLVVLNGNARNHQFILTSFSSYREVHGNLFDSCYIGI